MSAGIDAVDALEFTKAVGKRAVYEAFTFRPRGGGDVEVTNESHGDADDDADHTYTVHVVGGIPSDCECPADEYHEGACKHRVALAMRPALLEAAEAGAEEPLLADGGAVIDDEPADCECDELEREIARGLIVAEYGPDGVDATDYIGRDWGRGQ